MTEEQRTELKETKEQLKAEAQKLDVSTRIAANRAIDDYIQLFAKKYALDEAAYMSINKKTGKAKINPVAREQRAVAKQLADAEKHILSLLRPSNGGVDEYYQKLIFGDGNTPGLNDLMIDDFKY